MRKTKKNVFTHRKNMHIHFRKDRRIATLKKIGGTESLDDFPSILDSKRIKFDKNIRNSKNREKYTQIIVQKICISIFEKIEE